jgi:hypothetical protein
MLLVVLVFRVGFDRENKKRRPGPLRCVMTLILLCAIVGYGAHIGWVIIMHFAHNVQFYPMSYKFLRFMCDTENLFYGLIPLNLLRNLPKTYYTGWTSYFNIHDVIYAEMDTDDIQKMYMSDASIGSDIILSWIHSGSPKLLKLVETYNLTYPSLGGYNSTHFGLHMLPPNMSKSKGVWMVINGYDRMGQYRTSRRFPSILLDHGFEVILFDGNFHNTLPFQKNAFFDLQSPLVGIYIYGHEISLAKTSSGNDSDKTHYILMERDDVVPTLELLRAFAMVYHDKILLGLQVGVLSCRCGVITPLEIYASIPQIGQLYLSSAGDYVTTECLSDKHVRQDSRLYRLGEDISPLEFISKRDSTMARGKFIFETREPTVAELEETCLKDLDDKNVEEQFYDAMGLFSPSWQELAAQIHKESL